MLLAPRGELALGALRIKGKKKKLFLFLSKIMGIYQGLFWQASSAHERRDILVAMGGAIENRLWIAPNIPQDPAPVERGSDKGKGGGPLRIICFSRVSPVKNLDYALRILRQVRTPVEFEIYGVIDDEPYWQLCKEIMEGLPEHIEVVYRGTIPHTRVTGIVADRELFFLPTLGENYGHAIAESLSQGTPVLISDQTPWRNLELEGAGWDLPLGDEALFAQAIEKLAQMDAKSYALLRKTTAEYAARKLGDPQIIESNRSLFLEAAQKDRA